MHGATFLAFKARGEVRERAAEIGRRLWWAQLVLFVGLIGPTYAVREDMLENLVDHPWTLVFPLLAAGALVALFVYSYRLFFRAPPGEDSPALGLESR
jgi:cytochrome bd-type quinol oxidase subunit 2